MNEERNKKIPAGSVQFGDTVSKLYSSNLLVAEAEAMGDVTETMYAAEAMLLRNVVDAASNLDQSIHCKSFREQYPIGQTSAALCEAVNAYNIWLADAYSD